jgi:CMP-N-acetylneuraminic acid synthetase
MQRLPKVTVYIVNHNYGRFLPRAIESVLNQSLQDFELLIIDDGSTDDSQAIIERYVGHPKVFPIFQQNKGLTVTNNIAMRKARGRYIMRLDADDWLDENALTVMAGAMDQNDALGLVFPDFYLTDESGQIIELVRRHDFREVTLLDQPAHGACTMIRLKCLMDLGGYDEKLLCQDGYDLWIRFIEHFEVKNINLPLFYYRQHGTSLTRNERRILDTRAQIIERHSKSKGEAPSTVAIIPVRGRLLDPASPVLDKLGDRALIDWTINAALEARHVQRVIVTSPDPDILDHVGKFGKSVFPVLRDPRLAMLNTTLADTLLAALEEFATTQFEPQATVVLKVESPFRGAQYIDTAIEVMVLFETDCVIGVRPDSNQFFRHNGSGLEPIRRTADLRLEREDLFREAGGLHVFRTQYLKENRGVVGGRVGHVVLDQQSALYISSDWEWSVAERIAASSPFAARSGRTPPP